MRRESLRRQILQSRSLTPTQAWRLLQTLAPHPAATLCRRRLEAGPLAELVALEELAVVAEGRRILVCHDQEGAFVPFFH